MCHYKVFTGRAWPCLTFWTLINGRILQRTISFNSENILPCFLYSFLFSPLQELICLIINFCLCRRVLCVSFVFHAFLSRFRKLKELLSHHCSKIMDTGKSLKLYIAKLSKQMTGIFWENIYMFLIVRNLLYWFDIAIYI